MSTNAKGKPAMIAIVKEATQSSTQRAPSSSSDPPPPSKPPLTPSKRPKRKPKSKLAPIPRLLPEHEVTIIRAALSHTALLPPSSIRELDDLIFTGCLAGGGADARFSEQVRGLNSCFRAEKDHVKGKERKELLRKVNLATEDVNLDGMVTFLSGIETTKAKAGMILDEMREDSGTRGKPPLPGAFPVEKDDWRELGEGKADEQIKEWVRASVEDQYEVAKASQEYLATMANVGPSATHKQLAARKFVEQAVVAQKAVPEQVERFCTILKQPGLYEMLSAVCPILREDRTHMVHPDNPLITQMWKATEHLRPASLAQKRPRLNSEAPSSMTMPRPPDIAKLEDKKPDKRKSGTKTSKIKEAADKKRPENKILGDKSSQNRQIGSKQPEDKQPRNQTSGFLLEDGTTMTPSMTVVPKSNLDAADIETMKPYETTNAEFFKEWNPYTSLPTSINFEPLKRAESSKPEPEPEPVYTFGGINGRPLSTIPISKADKLISVAEMGAKTADEATEIIRRHSPVSSAYLADRTLSHWHERSISAGLKVKWFQTRRARMVDLTTMPMQKPFDNPKIKENLEYGLETLWDEHTAGKKKLSEAPKSDYRPIGQKIPLPPHRADHARKPSVSKENIESQLGLATTSAGTFMRRTRKRNILKSIAALTAEDQERARGIIENHEPHLIGQYEKDDMIDDPDEISDFTSFELLFLIKDSLKLEYSAEETRLSEIFAKMKYMKLENV